MTFLTFLTAITAGSCSSSDDEEEEDSVPVITTLKFCDCIYFSATHFFFPIHSLQPSQYSHATSVMKNSLILELNLLLDA